MAKRKPLVLSDKSEPENLQTGDDLLVSSLFVGNENTNLKIQNISILVPDEEGVYSEASVPGIDGSDIVDARVIGLGRPHALKSKESSGAFFLILKVGEDDKLQNVFNFYYDFDNNLIATGQDISSNGKNLTQLSHEHLNKTVIDLLSDDNGTLKYNGMAIGGVYTDDMARAAVALVGYLTSLSGHSLSELSEDSTHKTVTETEKSTWNNKQAAGDYATNTDLANGLASKVDTSVLSNYVPTARTINSKALSSDIILTTADIADSTDKRYCTNAEKTVLSNTSGTNTGDNAVNSLYNGLVSNANHTGDVTGSTALTIASGAVTLAKMANMATGSLIYRKTAGAGAPEVQTLATLKADLGLTGTNSGDQDLSGLVTKTTTVNGKALSTNISLTASDVGAQASNARLTDVAEMTPTSGTIITGNGTNFVNSVGYSTAATASTLVQRDFHGYAWFNYINLSGSVTITIPSHVHVETGSDGYVRRQTLSDFKSNLGIAIQSMYFHPKDARVGNQGSPAQIDGSQNRWYILFDASTVECVDYQFIMPNTYSTTMTLTLSLLYSMASATSGNVQFGCQVMAVTPGDAADIETDSFDTANTNYQAVASTAGYMKQLDITLTTKDSVAAGDLVVLRIYRNATDATYDTATGDAEVCGITLKWS